MEPWHVIFLVFIFGLVVYLGINYYRNEQARKLAEKLQREIASSANFLDEWELIAKKFWTYANRNGSLFRMPYAIVFNRLMSAAFLERNVVPPKDALKLPTRFPFTLRPKEEVLFCCKAKTIVIRQYGTKTVKTNVGNDFVVASTWGLHFMDGEVVRSVPRHGFDLLDYGSSCLDVQGRNHGGTRYKLKCAFGAERSLYEALTSSVGEYSPPRKKPKKYYSSNYKKKPRQKSSRQTNQR